MMAAATASMLLCVLLTACSALALAAPTPSPAPLILLPGTTGSYIESSIDSRFALPLCNHSGWQLLYPPSMTMLANPLALGCWYQQFELKFEASSKTWVEHNGVESRVLDFGGFGGMPLGSVAALFELEGWVPNRTLFGAPWDWRNTGGDLDKFYADLKALVERVYEDNGNTPVLLFGVSGGCQVGLGFAQRQTQEWKDKYVSKLVTVSPVWSGTVVSAIAALAGFDMTPQHNATRILLEFIQRLAEAPQNLWLFPRVGNTNHTWSADEVILSTPSHTYTAANISKALEARGLGSLVPQLQVASEETTLRNFDAPGIDMLVTYGYDVPTTTRASFSQDLTHKFPLNVSVVEESGDGIVPVRSGLRSTEWEDKQKALGKQLHHLGYAKQQHADCFANDCFEKVIAFLKGAPPSARHEWASVNHTTKFSILPTLA